MPPCKRMQAQKTGEQSVLRAQRGQPSVCIQRHTPMARAHPSASQTNSCTLKRRADLGLRVKLHVARQYVLTTEPLWNQVELLLGGLSGLNQCMHTCAATAGQMAQLSSSGPPPARRCYQGGTLEGGQAVPAYCPPAGPPCLT